MTAIFHQKSYIRLVQKEAHPPKPHIVVLCVIAIFLTRKVDRIFLKHKVFSNIGGFI